MAITYVNGSDNLKNGSGTAVCRAQLSWELTSSTATSVTYTLGVHIYCIRYGYSTTGALSATLSSTGQTSKSVSGQSCNLSAGGRKQLIANTKYTFAKQQSSRTVSIDFSVGSTGSSVSGTSTGTLKVTIPALASYTVSYNGNGATSGSMSTQTKYYGKSSTLRSNAFTRTGYTFKNFNTNSSGTGTSYSSGGTYTANANATLYAQWVADTKTISYNSNGGSGSISSQTKTYDKKLTLSNGSGFTRTNYTLTGWNSQADGQGTSYSLSQVLSGTFLPASNIVLYAQWQTNYVSLTISDLKVERVNSSGTATDDGTYLKVTFGYKAGKVGTSWQTPHCTLYINRSIHADPKYDADLTYSSSTGTGTFSQQFGTYGKDYAHTVSVVLTDTYGEVSDSYKVSTTTYPIDLRIFGDNENKKVYMGVMRAAREVEGYPLSTAPISVDGNAKVSGDANIIGDANISSDANVGGDVHTTGKYYFGESNIQLRGIMFTSVDTEATSVPANGYTVVSTTYTIPSGYTAVLVSANVRGTGTNYTRVNLTAWGTSTEGNVITLSGYARNLHTSDASISVRFRLLLLTSLS